MWSLDYTLLWTWTAGDSMAHQSLKSTWSLLPGCNHSLCTVMYILRGPPTHQLQLSPNSKIYMTGTPVDYIDHSRLIDMESINPALQLTSCWGGKGCTCISISCTPLHLHYLLYNKPYLNTGDQMNKKKKSFNTQSSIVSKVIKASFEIIHCCFISCSNIDI